MNAKIKNLVKSAVLGVAVLGGAIAMQSFNEINTSEQNQATRYWINTGTQYEEVSSPPNPTTNCQTPSDYDCVVQSEDQDIDSEFPLDEAENQNVTPHPLSSKAIYQ